MKSTKTTNRLHFEDLEPHRFENLCLELLNRKYEWQHLDPVGILGDDDGIDIYGVLSNGIECFCQVKRYKSISPSEIRDIIDRIINKNEDRKPDSKVIVMVCCEISKKCYDEFYSYAKEKGFVASEIFTGMKIEMALQENHDLLYKYFNIGEKKTKQPSVASILKKAQRVRKEAEKKLLSDIPAKNNIYQKLGSDPLSIECYLLTSVASLSSDRYGDTNQIIKAELSDFIDEGFRFCIYGLQNVVFNRTNKSFSVKEYYYQPSENEFVFKCQILGIIRYKRVNLIEELGDMCFCEPIFHINTNDISGFFDKIYYKDYATKIVFDPSRKLDDYDIEELIKYIDNTQKS